MSEKRFVKVYSQGTMQGATVWVDTTTGVNYLSIFAGYGLGTTVLVDKDGKPIVTPEEELNRL